MNLIIIVLFISILLIISSYILGYTIMKSIIENLRKDKTNNE